MLKGISENKIRNEDLRHAKKKAINERPKV